MDSDLQKLESQLQGLRPAGLDEALLDRLTNAVSGNMKVTPVELRATEAASSKLEPAGLSDALRERLVEVVEKVPFPVDEKVVLFPKGTTVEEQQKKKSGPKWWAAAAAVALAGGLSALMVSPPEESAKISKFTPATSMASSGSFVPAAFNSGVSDTDDLGVMWTGDRKPVRVVRVTYMDRVIFTNDKGDRVQRDVPRVEYLVVPEDID